MYMCAPGAASPDYNTDCEYSQGETLNSLEAALALAQTSFTDYFFETTGSIHGLALKMGVLRSTVHGFVPAEDAINRSSQHAGLAEEIQQQLCESIQKKKVRIRRSLLKLSNLSAQYSLLNRPYYELKAYCEQIGQCRRTLHIKSMGKLTYVEALQSVGEIIQDVEQVNHKTAHLLTEEGCVQPFLPQELTDYMADEYKSLPTRP